MKRYKSPFRWLLSAVGLILVSQVGAQQSTLLGVATSLHHSAATHSQLDAQNKSEKVDSNQLLSLHQALQLGVANYETIKAKQFSLSAAQANHSSSRTLYLPEIALSAQQFYGTANALHGPQYGFGEGTVSMGAPQAAQNWDAAFSALYSANINWNIYSFGARSSRVNLAKNKIAHSQADLEQELFEHQIKVASAYFDLVALEEIVKVQQRNCERAAVVLSTVKALVTSGLRPGVELSMAEAEVASATISLLKAEDQHALALKELVIRMGVEYQPFQSDGKVVAQFPVGTLFRADVATNDSMQRTLALQIAERSEEEVSEEAIILMHPALRTQDAAIEESRIQTRFYQADGLPKLNVVGSVAARGSGFRYNYAQDTKNLSSSYLDGVGMDRSNYLVGINLSWSITSLFKNRSLSRAQKQRTEALVQQRTLTHRQLDESYRHATRKRNLTEQQYVAVLKQVEAATQSYEQYQNLYSNGLAVVDEVISSLYQLARAESERAVIQVNLWHAFLLQAASSGEIEPLLSSYTNE